MKMIYFGISSSFFPFFFLFCTIAHVNPTTNSQVNNEFIWEEKYHENENLLSFLFFLFWGGWELTVDISYIQFIKFVNLKTLHIIDINLLFSWIKKNYKRKRTKKKRRRYLQQKGPKGPAHLINTGWIGTEAGIYEMG